MDSSITEICCFCVLHFDKSLYNLSAAGDCIHMYGVGEVGVQQHGADGQLGFCIANYPNGTMYSEAFVSQLSAIFPTVGVRKYSSESVHGCLCTRVIARSDTRQNVRRCSKDVHEGVPNRTVDYANVLSCHENLYRSKHSTPISTIFEP